MNIGAMWVKKSQKDGQPYISGQIEFPGMKLNFAAFKNLEKNAENQPDYNIVWSPPKAEGQGFGGNQGYGGNQSYGNGNGQQGGGKPQGFEDDFPY